MTLENRLSGVIVPVVTPFSNGRLAENELETVSAHLRKAGIDGEFYLGETGEFRFMTKEEKKRVIDFVSKLPKNGVKVIVGVGSEVLSDTIELSQYAEEKCIDAVVLPPLYHPLMDPVDLAGMLLRETRIPLVIYDNPGITWGRSIYTEDVATLVLNKDYGRRVIAIKDSSGNHIHLTDLTLTRDLLAPWLSVFQGSEEAFIDNPIVKINGIVPGSGNFDPELLVGIYRKISEKRINELEPDFRKLAGYHSAYRQNGNVQEIKKRLNAMDLISSSESRRILVG